MTNTQEHPQSDLLCETLAPVLAKLYPGGQCFVGCDVGIYWKFTNPVLAGVVSPDWSLVPNVPAMLDGRARRSYVLWREKVRPLVLVEYVSGDGSEERDQTPEKGKFWVYENAIRSTYYAIFDGWQGKIEVFELVGGKYQSLSPNAAGRFSIPPLGVELGLWHGKRRDITGFWVRPWQDGKMLPHPLERALVAESALDHTRELLDEEVEKTKAQRERADQEAEKAKTQRERSDRLAAKLRALGIDPDAV